MSDCGTPRGHVPKKRLPTVCCGLLGVATRTAVLTFFTFFEYRPEVQLFKVEFEVLLNSSRVATRVQFLANILNLNRPLYREP